MEICPKYQKEVDQRLRRKIELRASDFIFEKYENQSFNFLDCVKEMHAFRMDGVPLYQSEFAERNNYVQLVADIYHLVQAFRRISKD